MSDISGFASKAGRHQLASQATALEAHIRTAHDCGEPLPAEAVAMLSSLREVIDALDRLTATLGHDGANAVPELPSE